MESEDVEIAVDSTVVVVVVVDKMVVDTVVDPKK